MENSQSLGGLIGQIAIYLSIWIAVVVVLLIVIVLLLDKRVHHEDLCLVYGVVDEHHDCHYDYYHGYKTADNSLNKIFTHLNTFIKIEGRGGQAPLPLSVSYFLLCGQTIINRYRECESCRRFHQAAWC